MPTANVYYQSPEVGRELQGLAPKLRALLASELSGESRRLDSNEISLRFISVEAAAMMIAAVEVEVTAQQYPERVARVDTICLEVRSFLRQSLPGIEDIRVWLVLCELGHSWEE